MKWPVTSGFYSNPHVASILAKTSKKFNFILAHHFSLFSVFPTATAVGVQPPETSPSQTPDLAQEASGGGRGRAPVQIPTEAGSAWTPACPRMRSLQGSVVDPGP